MVLPDLHHRGQVAIRQVNRVQQTAQGVGRNVPGGSAQELQKISGLQKAEMQKAGMAYERLRGSLHIPSGPPGPSNRWGSRSDSQKVSHPSPAEQLTGSERGVVEGVVKTITMENKSTGYMVAKVKVADGHVAADKVQRKGVVTVVTYNKPLMVGRKVRLDGVWKRHPKFGQQLQVEILTPFESSEKDEVLAMLHAAGLPGVGPVTANRLAEQFGSELSRVLDHASAARKLAEARGVGPKSAARIKAAWDASRGRREAASFLQGLGLSGRLVQRIVERHGESTREAVSQDPYYALRNIRGMSLRVAESVARAAGQEGPQFPSRAAMGLQDVLLEAARNGGHTFLPWEQLQAQTLKYLGSLGMPWKGSDLCGVAATAASWGDLVLERGEAAQTGAALAESCLTSHLVASVKGLGQKRAKMLVDHFGSRVLQLPSGPETLPALLAVPGLSPKAARDIAGSWAAARNREPPIMTDPSPEEPDQGPRRPAAAGPTWSAVDGCEELLPAAQREQAAEGPAEGAWSGSERCYHPEMHAAEVTVARELARLAARAPLPFRGTKDPWAKIDAWISRNEAETGIRLSEGQRAAVKAASNAPVLVLTGGPGCGKTYTTATIVKLWCAMRKSVKLAAPTGRASQRLQEMAKVPSSTIHRLLQYQASGGRRPPGAEEEEEEDGSLQGSYRHCRANPLAAEAVLVDEAAMLDITLAAQLLEALPPHCQLVLVGDVDQLPPVGPGTVLSAAIQSGVIPVVDLREIFRQAQQSDIVSAAHAVQQGRLPSLQPLPLPFLESKAAGPQQSDALWVKPESAQDGKALQSIVLKVLQNFVRPQGFNPALDVQVLVPMRRGTAGVEVMNQQLQALLNPPGSGPELARSSGRAGGPVFRLHDRVIQTINNYQREVFNGDPGFVVAVDPQAKALTVEFPETDFEKLQAGKVTKCVEYKASAFWELELAWATTVHKAQGGESPCVLLLLSSQHKPLLTRRLLYTALTRAKKLVIVVGPESALRNAVAEVKGDSRLSSLQPRLQAHAQKLNVSLKEMQRFGVQPANAAPVEVPFSDSSPEVEKILDATSNIAKNISAGDVPASASAAQLPRVAKLPPPSRQREGEQARGARVNKIEQQLGKAMIGLRAPGRARPNGKPRQPASSGIQPGAGVLRAEITPPRLRRKPEGAPEKADVDQQAATRAETVHLPATESGAQAKDSDYTIKNWSEEAASLETTLQQSRQPVLWEAAVTAYERNPSPPAPQQALRSGKPGWPGAGRYTRATESPQAERLAASSR